MALGDLSLLDQREILVEVPRSVEIAPGQTSDRSRSGIGEDLAREGSRAIRRDAAAVVGIERGSGDEHGAVSRHPEVHDLIQLRFGQRRIGRVVYGSAGAVERVAAGQDRKRSAGLPGHVAADPPSAQRPVKASSVEQMTLPDRQIVHAVGLDRVRDAVDGARLFDLRIVDVEERLEIVLAIPGGIAQRLGVGVIRL